MIYCFFLVYVILSSVMSVSGSLQDELSKGTTFLGLQLWVLICICVVMFIILILSLLYIWLIFLRKSNNSAKFISEDIKIEAFAPQTIVCDFHSGESISTSKGIMDQISENWILNLRTKLREDKNIEQCNSIYEDNGRFLTSNFRYLCPSSPTSPLIDFPVLWGHWFTKRDLELATKDFSKENIIGEGGYGVVYRGQLADGTEIAVKRILNNTGQAEKEFRVEVEAIGHVRHNNLVRLLGYCIEGIHRMLVYEYVDNGNLEQWLHGNNVLSWEFRMKIIHGTARALSYLHEAIEPKVVHRDIKASNILVDKDFNAKVSDFGLAKLLGSDQSHVTTRVMGTFGYVAPEYAESGLLNEGSDVYSFGVLLMELITGRDPMDYSRPANEVNIVEWIEMMIENQMVVEVVDPKLEDKPAIEVFEGTLQVALTCVDLEPSRRPKMSQVLQMLETMV